VGLDPLGADRGKEGHFGLRGMRERAARIAGKLIVTSSPESGTQVKLVSQARSSIERRLLITIDPNRDEID